MLDGVKSTGNFFEVFGAHPLSLALLLVVAGLIAALIPATRAASIEPMRALRAE